MNAVSSSSALQGPVQRLAALRQAMQKQGIDAWIIPSADPHLSEYLPEHWQGRRSYKKSGSSLNLLYARHSQTLDGVKLPAPLRWHESDRGARG